MSRKIEDRLTPVNLDEILVATSQVWLHRLRGAPPPTHAVEIIVAQWAVETGWGKYCHCFNVGNRKAKPGGEIDWTFFKCGEELAKSTASAEAKRDSRVIIVREYVAGGRAMASVKVFPEHPWCCFGAFDSLYAGVADHLELLHRRFAMAFTGALQGDPTAFATELKRARYYTASVEQYTRTLLGCLPRVQAASAELDWEALPVMTQEQRRSVEGQIALAATLTDDLWSEMRAERDLSVAGDDS